MSLCFCFFFFFFNDPATTEIYTLSLHDALPSSTPRPLADAAGRFRRPLNPNHNSAFLAMRPGRSEEHTSELQSPCNLVCRLLLEKKKKNKKNIMNIKKKKKKKKNIKKNIKQ